MSDQNNKTCQIEKYYKAFPLNEGQNKLALDYALDIRKFEIELYWKRATYFWTFIGAAFTGFIALNTSDNADKVQGLILLVATLGLLFSFAWVLVNKGSKFWQENWEHHVDMLENPIIGPLYKTILVNTINKPIKGIFTQSGPYSVSKVNLIISGYVCLIWCGLWGYSLEMMFEFVEAFPTDWVLSLVVIALTLMSLLLLMCWGQSSIPDNPDEKSDNFKVKTRCEITRK